MSQLQNWYRRWNWFQFGRRDLESLLFNVPPASATHRQKRLWVLELLEWIHRRGRADSRFYAIKDVVLARVAFLLWSLERSENFRVAVANTFHDVLLHSEITDLLVNIGVPNHRGFISEVIERIMFKILPQPPQDHDLAVLVTEVFDGRGDLSWLRRMDKNSFSQLVGTINGEGLRVHFQRQVEDAIVMLAMQVRTGGMAKEIRERLTQKDIRKISFFLLVESAEKFIEDKNLSARRENAACLLKEIDNSFSSVEDVYSHLNEYGVSVSIVFHLDRLKLQLSRMRTLINLLAFDEQRIDHLHELLSNLVEDLAKSHSIRELFVENLHLVSQKISDRSAETGEHYITRTRNELIDFLNSAIGGGLIMGFTTLIKYMIVALPLAPLMLGFGAAINYATTFLLIQLLGYTLATKQPAMTATTLAAKMQSPEDLVEEVIHLFRSQFVAVLGNLLAVPPMVIFLDSIIRLSTHRHILDVHHAEESVRSVSLAGPGFLYAIFTGVLLFASSQIGGWIDNWWAFRKMSPALRYSRKLQFVFGERGAARIALFFSKSIGGLAGNISLGFLLGIIPVVFKFVGVPMDIRHVTLSTGMLTAGSMALGVEFLKSWDFVLAVLGIFTIGFLNIVSAFYFSMLVALRAREVEAPARSKIYRAFWRQVWRRPSQLFWI